MPWHKLVLCSDLSKSGDIKWGVAWRWIYNRRGPDSFKVSLGIFNFVLIFGRLLKVKEELLVALWKHNNLSFAVINLKRGY